MYAFKINVAFQNYVSGKQKTTTLLYFHEEIRET